MLRDFNADFSPFLAVQNFAVVVHRLGLDLLENRTEKMFFEGSGRVGPFKCPFRSGALILSSRVGGRDRTDDEGDFSFRGEKGGEEEGDRPTTTDGGGGGGMGSMASLARGRRRERGKCSTAV